LTEAIVGSDQRINLEPMAGKLAERYSLLSHLAVAFSLAQEAIPAIQANPKSEWFAWVELIAALALMVAALRELKLRKAEGHEAIAWTEIFAGGVLLVEAALKWREGPRHYPLAVARAIAAGLVILLGFSHARVKNAKALHIDAEGIRWRRNLFLRKRIAWEDLAQVSIDKRVLSLKSRSGADPSLSLWRLRNGNAVADAVANAARARDIAVTDTREKR
jgi:hypothetical protein